MEVSDSERSATSSQAPSDELNWSALLAAYRLGPKEQWSGLLLESLGPWLTNARQALVEVPPYLDDEDIAQQLALEVLGIAARWQPLCEDNWIPRKLVEDAERRVRKALKRERSRSSRAVELTDEIEAPQRAEPDFLFLFDTPIGKASPADLRLIYRVKVLGEPVAALAQAAGITPRQMRRRVQEARGRARAAVDEAGERA
jgi:DNA-directed RNA polymerase specialized sigma24 family protein